MFVRDLNGLPDIGAVEANVLLDPSDPSKLTVYGTSLDDEINLSGGAVTISPTPDYSYTIPGSVTEITVSALAGNDVIYGSEKANRIFGGEGDDYYEHNPHAATTIFYEGAGDDTYVIRDMLNQTPSAVSIEPDPNSTPTGIDVLDFAFMEYDGVTVSLEEELTQRNSRSKQWFGAYDITSDHAGCCEY